MRFPRMRFTAKCLFMTLFTALGVSSRGSSQPAQVPDRPEGPLTIAASCVGRFAQGHSWHLSVNSAGEAELTIDAFPEPTRRRFVVPRQRLAELRKALDEERFFDLAEEYGVRVTDGSTTTVTVVAGDRVKSIRLRFLMNWVNGDKADRAKLREPSRAVRISVLIRGWFDDPEAVDLRRYHRMVLDAAKG